MTMKAVKVVIAGLAVTAAERVTTLPQEAAIQAGTREQCPLRDVERALREVMVCLR
jgi:hypothetical protein